MNGQPHPSPPQSQGQIHITDIISLYIGLSSIPHDNRTENTARIIADLERPIIAFAHSLGGLQ